MNYGFSIGGKVTKYNKDYTRIMDVKMLEVSLVAIPANHDTFGTVQISKDYTVAGCINGACKNLIKQYEVEKMTEINNNKPEKPEEGGENNIEELINTALNKALPAITEQITSEVKNNLESIVDEKITSVNDSINTLKEEITELKNNTTKSDEDEEELEKTNKPKEEEEEEESTKPEKEEDVEKNIDYEKLGNIIGEAITKGFEKQLPNRNPDFKINQIEKKQNHPENSLYPQDVSTKGITIQELAKKQEQTRGDAVNQMITDTLI